VADVMIHHMMDHTTPRLWIEAYAHVAAKTGLRLVCCWLDREVCPKVDAVKIQRCQLKCVLNHVNAIADQSRL